MRHTFTLLILSFCLFKASAQYPFNETKLSDEKRIDNLISLMTLDEKINALGNNTYIPRLGVQSAGSVEGIHGVVLGGPSWNESRGQNVFRYTIENSC
jgi:beta-glucosidase